MPRPRKCRKVCHLPHEKEFVPANGCQNRPSIVMTVDEYETIRLIDKEGFSQEECGEYMHIARTTVQQIYTNARKKIAETLSVGLPTLEDIIKELSKPGRDPRDELPAPLLRTDILGIESLKEGMELTGTVRNVIDFGAFIDIGVHQDGLVHISEVCNRRLRHPSEVVKVGDIVKVVVLGVDEKRHRISLSMKQAK